MPEQKGQPVPTEYEQGHSEVDLPIISADGTENVRILTGLDGNTMHTRQGAHGEHVVRVGRAPGRIPDSEETAVMGPAAVNSLKDTVTIPAVTEKKVVDPDQAGEALDALLRGPMESLTVPPSKARVDEIRGLLANSREPNKPEGMASQVKGSVRRVVNKTLRRQTQ